MCNCEEGRTINLNMGCCVPIVANADAYYTKSEIDKKIEDIEASGCCITEEEVDEKISAATEGKLDASAYTPTDLSDYYTKEETNAQISSSTADMATKTWVNNQHYLTEHQPLKTINGESLVGSGNIVISGSADLSNYYNKQEINAMLDDKATKTWVTYNYATNAELIQYIENLQQQINSLQASISGCCGTSSGETIYRWITMVGENDYVCSGTTKFTKEQKQQSTDNGVTWTNVTPAEYRRGDIVIEVNCADCGYVGCVVLSATTMNGDVIIPNGYEQVDGRLSVDSTHQGNMAQSALTVSAVTISDCVTRIGHEAFAPMSSTQYYGNLEVVEIPSSVTRIEFGAFKTRYLDNCHLKTVIVRATVPPTMSNDYEYFSTEGGLTIYVPSGSVDTYKSASGWSQYASRIQAIV